MNFKSLALFLPVILLTTSCFKTAEQIRRDELVDTMAVQMVDGQKLTANTTLKIQNLEEQIVEIRGLIENSDHEKNKLITENLEAINADLKILKENYSSLEKKQGELETTVNAQKAYIEEVLKALKDITKKPAPKKKLTPYQKAVNNYRNGNYTAAKKTLGPMIADNKLKGNDAATATYYLGMIAYREKNYNDCLVYFSKLFTEHSKSGLNSSGLLHMGRCFTGLGQKDQAKEAYNTFLTKYPNSRYAKTVKEELAKLK